MWVVGFVLVWLLKCVVGCVMVKVILVLCCMFLVLMKVCSFYRFWIVLMFCGIVICVCRLFLLVISGIG